MSWGGLTLSTSMCVESLGPTKLKKEGGLSEFDRG